MTSVKSIAELKQMPFWSRFTEEQIRRQYERSLEGLEKMHVRALRIGGKVNGFTAESLKGQIDQYKAILS